MKYLDNKIVYSNELVKQVNTFTKCKKESQKHMLHSANELCAIKIGKQEGDSKMYTYQNNVNS